MATKLTKPVTRVIGIKDINGMPGDVAVTITAGGLHFHKGRRKFGIIPWADIIKLNTLPMNIPARFSGNPMGWLIELGK
jgi:hypothetical protein